MAKRKPGKRRYVVTRVFKEAFATRIYETDDEDYRVFLHYEPSHPELYRPANPILRNPVGPSTNWGFLQKATKFDTVLEAMVIAMQYEGSVVGYNSAARSWGRLTQEEIDSCAK